MTIRFSFLVSLLILALASSLRGETPPNIVLIVSDDQGYRDLGCFGSTEVFTPHLDRLAKEGVRLTNFYVTWPACTPSRGSILTGRYPQRNGLYDMIRNDLADLGHRFSPEDYAVSPERILGMDTREITIADVLSRTGYTCGVFGKWDGGQLRRFLPLQRGFAKFYGFVNTGIDYYTHDRYGVPSMYRNNEPTTEDVGTYCTILFQREALRFIDDHAQQPFLLYLPFNAPHGASNLDPKIRGAAQAPAEFKRLYPHLEDTYTTGTRYGEETQVPSRSKRRLEYIASITAMDAAIGEILAALDRHQLSDNTLVVFFSDNGGSGEADNAPLRGGKSQMFEGGIRVPCIARFPNRIPAGSSSDELLTALELFPTFLGVADTPLPRDIVYDGFDMMPVLCGDEQSSRNEMFWQRRGDQAARVGQWKWVDSARGGGLFDLASDPAEQTDLSKSHPEILEMVRGRFASWQREMTEAEPRGPFRDY